MRQISVSVDTATLTCHALHEVSIQHISAQLQQRNLTFFNTIADNRLQFEVLCTLFFHSLLHSTAQTACVSKDTSKVRSILQTFLFQCRDVDLPAVKHCLQLFKSQCTVDIRCNRLLADLHLLCGTRSDKYDLRRRILLLNMFPDHRHR